MLNQLQQQLQRLRDEVNSISQLASQLQQVEQNNSAQLQQLQQKEIFAAQNLQRIQYLAGQLHQDITQASNMAQQLTGASVFPQAQATYQSPAWLSPFQQQATATQTGWAQPSWAQTAWAGQTGTFPRGYGFTSGYGAGQAEYGTPITGWSAQYMPYQASPAAKYTTGQVGVSPQYGPTRQGGWATQAQYTTTPGQWSTMQRGEAQIGRESENQLIWPGQMQAGWSDPAQTGWAGQTQTGFTGQAQMGWAGQWSGQTGQAARYGAIETGIGYGQMFGRTGLENMPSGGQFSGQRYGQIEQ